MDGGKKVWLGLRLLAGIGYVVLGVGILVDTVWAMLVDWRPDIAAGGGIAICLAIAWIGFWGLRRDAPKING